MKTQSMKPQYLFNESGKKTFVLLPVRKYEELIEDLHDLAIVAERRDEPTITLEEFEKELEVNGYTDATLVFLGTFYACGALMI